MDTTGLHAYDVLMLVVLVGTVLFGFWKGMAWQIASFASILVSAAVAFRVGPEVADSLGQDKPWHRYVTMLVLYVLTSLAIWLIFRLVAGAIDRVRLREFDRQIGALFGLAKGAVLCMILTFFVVTLSEQGRQIVLGTRSGRIIALVVERGAPVLPEEVTSVLGKYIDELDRKLDPATPPDDGSVLDRLSQGQAESETRRLGEAVMGDLKSELDRSAQRARQGAEKQLDRAADEADRRLEQLRKDAQRRLDAAPR